MIKRCTACGEAHPLFCNHCGVALPPDSEDSFNAKYRLADARRYNIWPPVIFLCTVFTILSVFLVVGMYRTDRDIRRTLTEASQICK